MGCPSSRFLYLNFKECALGCWSSRFLCSLFSNSKGLFGLWTLSVVNGKNVSVFDHLYLDASVYWVLCVTFTFMSCHSIFAFLYLVYIWFLYFVIIILFISLSYLKKKKNTHVFLYSYCFVQIWSSWKQYQLLFSFSWRWW